MGDESPPVASTVPKRKLIEVALPLEAINRESAREKEPFTRNHPRSLHIWWARRPLVTARAVLFSQLVDDPSSNPDLFPDEESQRVERERLHALIERLVVWENTRNEELLAEAQEEIFKSCGGGPPPVIDPFAGGGTIALEAQRLGLEAHASDLNPVAVLINKALIEIPQRFAGLPPVSPGLASSQLAGWSGATGLMADIRAYGDWLRAEAEERIGRHYPEATLSDGGRATAVAWIWARTVTCPNPVCGIEMPLVRSWWLGKRSGKEAYVTHRVVAAPEHPSGKRVDFEIGHDLAAAPGRNGGGTINRNGARCVACRAVAPLSHIRQASREGGLGEQLIAVVAEGHRRRLYCSPDECHREAAKVAVPTDRPEGALPTEALGFRVQRYGMSEWSNLFTPRQLLALTTVSNLVVEARERVLEDARRAAAPEGNRPQTDDAEAQAYADAVVTYLGLAVSRYADLSNSLCSWNQTNENIRALFSRQAVPMAWDFAEANPFGQVGIAGPLDSVAKALSFMPESAGEAVQRPAQDAHFAGQLISTDPPYYDNIGYSDLSDFFYVWLRRSLRDVHPELLRTMLVPKAEELVASPHRHEGKEGAKRFFEKGFREVFARAREGALPAFPITVYYAFKQSDSGHDGDASTGWETLLDGMINSGWAITATWPMRSERGGRMRGLGSNALSSSIVLALRPRPEDAATTDRRGLIAALQAELPGALRELQLGRIAPVDLPQAAIGPGMAVFSRYSSVIEPDGSKMTVRAALARINEILDQVLNEQEGDFDPTTRFALSWYRQHGYETGKFGDANNFANARNTSVETMARGGVLTSAAGKVALIAPDSLSSGYDPAADDQISVWEVLHHMIAAIERNGIDASAEILAAASSRSGDPVDADLVKELAFLLFSIAEKSGRTKDALAFNALATSWPDIVDAMREGSGSQDSQESFDV